MAVLLTILKITGIVLLSLIALVLLAVLIVLFVPVRYRIIARKKETSDDLYAKVGVTFLLHIISAGFVYEDDTDIFVKIFGIRIYPKKQNDNAGTAEEAVGSGEAPGYEDGGSVEATDHEEEYTVDWNGAEDDEPSDEYLSQIFGISEEDTQKTDTSEDEKDLWDRLEAFTDKLISKFSSLSEKYERTKRKIEYWKKAVNDKRNRRAAAHIKDEVVHVLKKAAPRKVTGLVHFGFDDPATTGKILSYLGIIYPVLPRKLVIEPDFEEPLIYGSADIKGRLALIVLGMALLKLFLDKDCRRMWNIYKKHKFDDNM